MHFSDNPKDRLTTSSSSETFRRVGSDERGRSSGCGTTEIQDFLDEESSNVEKRTHEARHRSRSKRAVLKRAGRRVWKAVIESSAAPHAGLLGPVYTSPHQHYGYSHYVDSPPSEGLPAIASGALLDHPDDNPRLREQLLAHSSPSDRRKIPSEQTLSTIEAPRQQSSPETETGTREKTHPRIVQTYSNADAPLFPPPNRPLPPIPPQISQERPSHGKVNSSEGRMRQQRERNESERRTSPRSHRRRRSEAISGQPTEHELHGSRGEKPQSSKRISGLMDQMRPPLRDAARRQLSSGGSLTRREVVAPWIQMPGPPNGWNSTAQENRRRRELAEARSNPGGKPIPTGEPHRDEYQGHDRTGYGSFVRFIRVYKSGKKVYWRMTINEFDQDEEIQNLVEATKGRDLVDDILGIPPQMRKRKGHKKSKRDDRKRPEKRDTAR